MNKINKYLKKKFFLKSVLPVSNQFGFDRGNPVDRYYIDKFLEKQSNWIRGTVIEIAENTYTKRFGGENVGKALTLHVNKDRGDDIIGDLVTGDGIPENIADCFIMTQTLPFIYDIHSAVKNTMKLIKPGGCILCTVPGITQISRYDMDRWGHFWSFTDLSLRKLFEEIVPAANITINSYGNVKSATSFLYGLAAEDLSKKDLDYRDNDYQVIITAIVIKDR